VVADHVWANGFGAVCTVEAGLVAAALLDAEVDDPTDAGTETGRTAGRAIEPSLAGAAGVDTGLGGGTFPKFATTVEVPVIGAADGTAATTTVLFEVLATAEAGVESVLVSAT